MLALHPKINGSARLTDRMVLAGFSLQDKLMWFLECLSFPSQMRIWSAESLFRGVIQCRSHVFWSTSGEMSLLMEKEFRPPQLVRYTIIVLSGKTFANAKPPHPPHEFRDFANLLVPDSAAELSKGPTVGLWDLSIATMWTYDLVNPGYRTHSLARLALFISRVLRSDTNTHPPSKSPAEAFILLSKGCYLRLYMG